MLWPLASTICTPGYPPRQQVDPDPLTIVTTDRSLPVAPWVAPRVICSDPVAQRLTDVPAGAGWPVALGSPLGVGWPAATWPQAASSPAAASTTRTRREAISIPHETDVEATNYAQANLRPRAGDIAQKTGRECDARVTRYLGGHTGS